MSESTTQKSTKVGERVRFRGGSMTLAVITAFTGLALPGGAAAQPVQAVAAPPDAAWRAAFDRGMEALQSRRFADAETALREALRLRPTPVTIYNLALALRGTGHYVETVELFDRYLAAPEAGAMPERLAAIRAETDDLRHSVARVDLNLQPANATLRVDARALRPDANGLRLDPGPHVLEVEAEGFVRDRRDITLAPGGQLVLAIALRPVATEGRLLVDPSVSGAVVSVDGQTWGSGRNDRPVAQGTHVVEVRAAGYEPWRREVRVQPQATLRIDAGLTATTARASRGWVLPVAIAGGAVVVAAIVVGVAFATRGEEPTVNGSWGNYTLP